MTVDSGCIPPEFAVSSSTNHVGSSGARATNCRQVALSIKEVDMSFFDQYRARLCEVLEELEVTDRDVVPRLKPSGPLMTISRMTSVVQQHNRCMYFAGNGASAAMAGHMALGLCQERSRSGPLFQRFCSRHGTGRTTWAMTTYLINRSAGTAVLATCLRSLRAVASSRNVLNAVEVARDLDLSVITFTGLNAGQPLPTTWRPELLYRCEVLRNRGVRPSGATPWLVGSLPGPCRVGDVRSSEHAYCRLGRA